jgi:acetylglutamate kinase
MRLNQLALLLKLFLNKKSAKIKTKQPAPLTGKRKAVEVAEQLEAPELAKTATTPKLQRVDAEDSRLAEQASQICELRAEIKKYETENLPKVQACSSSLSDLKRPDIYEYNNSAT